MKHIKDDKYINYELIKNEKYRQSYEIKNKVLYLNVPTKYEVETLLRFLDRKFNHVYNIMHDKELDKLIQMNFKN